MTANPWTEAVAYYEDLLADGDRDVLILQRLAERAAADDLAWIAEPSPQPDCLIVTPAGRGYSEREPFVLVTPLDDWPCYAVCLEPGGDGAPLATWEGEGEGTAVEIIRDFVTWLRDPTGPVPAVPEPEPGFE